MQIVCLDDEPLLLSQLERAVKEAEPTAEINGFSFASKFIEQLESGKLNPDVIFTDIEMPGLDGIDLAKRLNREYPNTNIIFVTGFSKYAVDAAKLYASGYVMKPVDSSRIREELDNLRHPIVKEDDLHIHVRTFGNFEVFSDETPLKFTRSKAKELLAYLIDRQGASCTLKELAAVLFENRNYDTSLKNQMQTYIASLRQTLKEVDAEDILIKDFNSIAVDINKFTCDYYDYLRSGNLSSNGYTGEYMTQYSWAESRVEYIKKPH